MSPSGVVHTYCYIGGWLGMVWSMGSESMIMTGEGILQYQRVALGNHWYSVMVAIVLLHVR